MKTSLIVHSLLFTLPATLLAMLSSALLGAALELDASVVARVWLAAAPACLGLSLLFAWLGRRAEDPGARHPRGGFAPLASSSR